MLDTLYKTDNAKCSHLLLRYRSDSLESIVCGICRVLVYTVTYVVPAYTVTSFVRVQLMWGNVLRVKIQKLSLSLLHCVLLLCIFSIPLTSKSSTVWCVVQFAKVSCNWFFCFLCSYVGAVSIHLDVEGVLRFSDIL